MSKNMRVSPRVKAEERQTSLTLGTDRAHPLCSSCFRWLRFVPVRRLCLTEPTI